MSEEVKFVVYEIFDDKNFPGYVCEDKNRDDKCSSEEFGCFLKEDDLNNIKKAAENPLKPVKVTLKTEDKSKASEFPPNSLSVKPVVSTKTKKEIDILSYVYKKNGQSTLLNGECTVEDLPAVPQQKMDVI